VEQGELDPARLESLQKLEAEARSYELRKQLGPARAEKQRGKVISRLVKQHKKLRGR
jgi:hypothetical protein